MSWAASILVAAIAGIEGILLAGLVAYACVGWYRISGFEGKSGFFVVGTALAGGVVAAVVGLVVARTVAGGSSPGFWKATGIAVGAVALSAGVAALVARMNADVPSAAPGEELDLVLEVRAPAGWEPPPPDEDAYVTLDALHPHTRKRGRSVRGDLDVAGARREEGRSILGTRVPIVTSRADGIIGVIVGTTWVASFVVPLRGEPSAAGTWSGWRPADADETTWTARTRLERRAPETESR